MQNGATKVPNTLGSRRAITARGYTFVEEGDIIIIQESLSPAEVKALLIESQEPPEAKSSTQNSSQHLAERIFIDVEEQGPVPDFLGHAMPISNGFNGDYFGRGGAKDSLMRSWVNQVLVSDVHGLNLHEKQARVICSTRASSDSYRAWFNPTLWLEGQATRSDLFDIGYAEYYQDFARSHSFTLNSLGYRGRPKRDVKFRWVHLESLSSNFQMLEHLVAECPFISKPLRSVALKVLLEASQQCSKPDASKSQIDTGNVIRYIGRHRVHSLSRDTDTRDTQPVIFVSTPYLLMAQKPPAAPVSGETRKRNLIEFLYGSESGSFQQPWLDRSTANGFKYSIAGMLEVPEASFLLIGSDETRTRRSDLVIEKECSHESFVHKAFGLPRNDRLSLGSYILVDEHDRLVNDSVWHNYLKSGEVERHVFRLTKTPSAFPAEHIKGSSTGSVGFKETSTDVSNHQAIALEPSHTRIYKSELLRPNELSFSISNNEIEVCTTYMSGMSYVIKPKESRLSWMILARAGLRNFKTGMQHSADEGLSAIHAKMIEINQKIHEQLDLATRDIMVSGTSRGDNDQLIVSDIGPEFLLANLISNLQNHTAMDQTGQSLDIIQHYRRVSSGLQYIAVRDPRRRRFLEISALEEETDALRAVIEIQRRMAKTLKRILSPDFFRNGTTDDEYLENRRKRHLLESEHLGRQTQKLSENIRTLETLLGIAQVTKYKMKQVLEVLDEGHGKAIRVFTFATLFFLPMSFVTSFFGMNTTDVRDIGWDQRLFWSSAIPLTVAVMSLALVYGYKWDTVLEFRDKVFKSHEPYQFHSIINQDVTTFTEERNGQTSIPIRPSASPKRSRLWVSGVERLRVGLWRKREAGGRQTTNESQV
ncbi:mg2+ transporter [Fusarium subglutinans]|uniref:Mg2+ transporter n=1 Tax=Gibberella subglutinans TaxID=42677 RepID=A0A8H5QEL9_GIBSU|nr:mg2+ transporter [Fusarium subglutinans]KAF5612456.1 mg2+ transporter [Fusarium subglutinans]